MSLRGPARAFGQGVKRLKQSNKLLETWRLPRSLRLLAMTTRDYHTASKNSGKSGTIERNKQKSCCNGA